MFIIEPVHSSVFKKKSKDYHGGRHWNLLEWLNNVDNTDALPSSPPSVQTINILLFYYQHESKLVPRLISELYVRSQASTKNQTP